MFCPACGLSLPDGSRFCTGCGSAVAPTPPPGAAPARGGATLSGGATLNGGGTPAPAANLPAGHLFHDRYEIEKVLGEGGMGVVYLARDRVTADRVCLKVIRPEWTASERAAKRLLREGKVTRNLRHPNVVALYDVNSAGGQLYLSMEYLEGQTLRRWLVSARRDRREVPWTVAVAVVREILRGLEPAHQAGLVHRDLKPENVMLLADPGLGEARLKILDFGIARAPGEGDQLTQQGAALGTPAYMAPEQETAADEVGPEADLYAAGAILYELLVGLPPRGRWELPGRIRSGLPPGLDAACEKALQAHPARRFRSVTEFLRALEGTDAAAPAPGGAFPAAAPPPPAAPWRPLAGSGWLGQAGKERRARFWHVWSWIPGLHFLSWLEAGLLSGRGRFFGWAALYFLPVFLLAAAAEEELGAVVLAEFFNGPTDAMEAIQPLFWISWIAGIVHVRRWRARIDQEIQGKLAPKP